MRTVSLAAFRELRVASSTGRSTPENAIRGGGSSLAFSPGGITAATDATDARPNAYGVGRSCRALKERRVQWCAVQVRVGSEDACARRLPVSAHSALDAAVARREVFRRHAGKWTIARDVLFPGYVLVATEDLENLSKDLAVLSERLNLIQQGGAVAALGRDELSLLEMLADDERVVRVSVADIVGGRLRVTHGPLMGHEDLVAKIDRHHRAAYLRYGLFSGLLRGSSGAADGSKGPMCGLAPGHRQFGLRVSLEVVSKS